MPATTFSHAGFRQKGLLLLSELVAGAPGAGTVARNSVESTSTLQQGRRQWMPVSRMTRPVARRRPDFQRPTTVAVVITAIVRNGSRPHLLDVCRNRSASFCSFETYRLGPIPEYYRHGEQSDWPQRQPSSLLIFPLLTLPCFCIADYE